MRDFTFGRIGKNTKRWAHTRAVTVTRRQLLSKESIKRYLWDYCENTTIHGFKYIGEQGRPKIERIWWIFVIGLSMAGSTYLISKVWCKWHDSSVIVSFSETSTPIWQIPFPTVTICSETKVRQNIFNFTYAMHSTNLSEDEEKKRDDISLVCDPHLTTNGSKFTNESTIDVIKELAPQFDQMMWICEWIYMKPCYDMFTPVMTEEGVCFQFNNLYPTELYRDIVVQSESEEVDEMLTKSYWSLEEGYDVSDPLETEPFRTIGAGADSGIFVTLRDYDYDVDYFCRGPVQGFKILLHNPAEIPKLSEHYFRLPHDQELILSMRPNMITTSEGLRSYQPSSRQCYFSSERHLAYFKIYTQHNCELECLTNYTLKKCQCAAVYMPKELKLEEIMLRMQRTQNLGNTCDCLPGCTSLQYDAETSQAQFDSFKLLGAYKENMSEIDGQSFSSSLIAFQHDDVSDDEKLCLNKKLWQFSNFTNGKLFLNSYATDGWYHFITLNGDLSASFHASFVATL